MLCVKGPAVVVYTVYSSCCFNYDDPDQGTIANAEIQGHVLSFY